MPGDEEARSAPHGRKMIEIRIRFWTDSIADRKGDIVPKHAWDAGVVMMQGNSIHEIEPGDPVPFNGMADLLSKIERVLISHGVKLHLSSRARKYLV